MTFWILILLEAVSMKEKDIFLEQLNFVLFKKFFKTINI